MIKTKAEAEAHQRHHGFLKGPVNAPESPVAAFKPKRGVKCQNKTEAEFGQILKVQYPDDTILFEAIKLRLADGCWYTPDFVRISGGLLWFYEVKGGHIWDDSKIKFKVATAQYPEFAWQMHQKKAGTWTRLL